MSGGVQTRSIRGKFGASLQAQRRLRSVERDRFLQFLGKSFNRARAPIAKDGG